MWTFCSGISSSVASLPQPWLTIGSWYSSTSFSHLPLPLCLGLWTKRCQTPPYLVYLSCIREDSTRRWAIPFEMSMQLWKVQFYCSWSIMAYFGFIENNPFYLFYLSVYFIWHLWLVIVYILTSYNKYHSLLYWNHGYFDLTILLRAIHGNQRFYYKYQFCKYGTLLKGLATLCK